jgi:hypothetical protein
MTARLRDRRASTTGGDAERAPAASGAETDPAAAKRAAVQRVLARRRPDRGPGESEFLPPQTVAEWADDCEAFLPPAGPHAALIRILEGARQGQAAAVAAVAAVCSGAELSSLDQFAAYQTWCAIRDGGLPDAKQIMSAVRAEWRRLGLQETKPGQPQAAEAGAR